jgi:hypothetical protein
METIAEATLEFKKRNQKAGPCEILAFIDGWTAHEVAIETATN